MIKLIWNLIATARIRVTGLKPERLLSEAAQADIGLRNVVRTDIASFEADVERRDLKKLERLLRKKSYRLTVLSARGILFRAERAKHRQALYGGLTLCLCAMIVLSQHTWTVRLFGSSDESLLTLAKEQGMLDWRFRVAGRVEACEQAILKHDKNILWSEVDVHGTVVDLYVKQAANRVPTAGTGPVIALKDGVVHNLIVFHGIPQVKNGDPVEKGQVLILPDENGLAEGKALGSVWYCAGEAVEKEKTEEVPTGRERKYLQVRLFGLTFETGDRPVFPSAALTKEPLPVYGLPISVIRIRERETRQETKTVLREEALASAEQNLKNRLLMELPGGAGMGEMKTTVTETDDAWIVNVTLETAENLAGKE